MVVVVITTAAVATVIVIILAEYVAVELVIVYKMYPIANSH